MRTKKQLYMALAVLAISTLFSIMLAGCGASEEEKALERVQNQAREAATSLEEQQKALDELAGRPWYGMYVSCNSINYDSEDSCVTNIDKRVKESIEEEKKKLQEDIDKLHKEYIDTTTEDVEREEIPAMGIDYFDVIEDAEKQIERIASRDNASVSARSDFTHNMRRDFSVVLNKGIPDRISLLSLSMNNDFLPLLNVGFESEEEKEEVYHGDCKSGEDDQQLADFAKTYRALYEHIDSTIPEYAAKLEDKDFSVQQARDEYVEQKLKALSDEEFDAFYAKYFELSNAVYKSWQNVQTVYEECQQKRIERFDAAWGF